jgi:hypothetical protein
MNPLRNLSVMPSTIARSSGFEYPITAESQHNAQLVVQLHYDGAPAEFPQFKPVLFLLGNCWWWR